MLRLALLLIVPCLISAEATCPDGKTTCPEGQACCTVNDKQSCCEEGQFPLRLALQAATISNSSVQNGLFDNCNTFINCDGTCCNSGSYGCCREYKRATCCRNNRCCPSKNTCCEGGCCPSNGRCCEDGCCPSNTQCCSGGFCCPSNSKCCSEGLYGAKRWCCKSNYRCGMQYMTCYSGAGALSPTTLVTLVAAWLVAYAFKKM